tara:strand:+ start:299 stop:970 length:672 start_codon:yes stop_codon:yes gene_type:complete
MAHTGGRNDLVERLCFAQKYPTSIKTKQLRIYKILRDNYRFGEYKSAIVVAYDEEGARHTHPEGYTFNKCANYDDGSVTVGRYIRFKRDGAVVKIVADSKSAWLLANHRTAKKKTRGLSWDMLWPNSPSVGQYIHFKSDSSVGQIVADGGDVWRVTNGRIAYKRRQGNSWEMRYPPSARLTRSLDHKWDPNGRWTHPQNVMVTYLSGLSDDTKLTEGRALLRN